ncbi:MAG: hypothetical protein M1818_004576 [Claussenomyces sp. TS43310]|nr:MAG: hypothetical protein M1818_004576 [Claussenomyces sp. TS43310]
MLLSPRRRRWPALLVLAFFFFVFVFRNTEIYTVPSSWQEHRIKAHAFPSVGVTAEDAHGFLIPSVAEGLCAAHNFDLYSKRDARRKVYDLFMVNTELDWLEIRLNELKDHVDYFVILEAERTFTGLPKPLYVRDNWERFKAFHEKIILRVLDDGALESTRTWDHEDLQRNAMFDQVLAPELTIMPSEDNALSKEQTPNAGDVILVSDIDEIPKTAAVTLLRNCDFPRRLTLRSRFYYYGFQWLHRGEDWPHPQATFYEGARTVRPADLRNGEGSYGGRNVLQTRLDKADLWNASWHCSTCFGSVDETTTKMSSFSHTPWNQEAFRQRQWVIERVRNGLDLFDRASEVYDKVEGRNWDIPAYLLRLRDSTDEEERHRFAYLVDRDPPNANFKDVSMEEAQASVAG